MLLLTQLMGVLNVVAMLLWLGLSAWCFPSLLRIIRGTHGLYDPLVALICMLLFNFFWFAFRPVVFGAHVEAMQPLEIVWRSASFAFAIACAAATVAVVRFYRGQS